MDILRRIFSIVFPGAGLAMLGRYLYNGAEITSYTSPYSYIILAITALLLLSFIVLFGVSTIGFSRQKLWAVVMSLCVILLGWFFFTNNVEKGIFAGDALTVLGALLTYLSLGGLIVSKKAQKKLQESKQIIIEV